MTAGQAGHLVVDARELSRETCIGRGHGVQLALPFAREDELMHGRCSQERPWLKYRLGVGLLNRAKAA